MPTFGQEPDPEEQKQLQAVARFVTVLEKNPRRGTALDRVYGHHVEFGTLDTFVSELSTRAASTAGGEPWMILGMIEYQRGNDAQAVEAFTKAESLRTKDPLASYYLGQAQIRIGDSSAAVASFERALQRKPQRADELEIFQQLGRVHQRAQRTDEAMKVWKRLEELYPDDARVLEQIAVTLAEEGQTAEALPRYEKLAATSKDDYRKTTFAITAAELIVKKGDKTEGIRRMEGLLADLNPDGWLYRDVRRRIDDCFLRTGDQDGLVSYYQTWLDRHPQDIEAMNRMARFLKQSARNPEAAIWLNKALTLAPNRADIRKTYIDLLAEDKRFEDAAAQYEQLLKTSPNNADYLRDWGKMVLRNKEKPEADRRKQAFSIWNQMLAPNPNDAVMVAQVADFCRQNQMLEEAESLYRKAVELAPSEPQYREYLGEFLSIQKRPDEAKAVWQAIAQGDRRNADNLARLAEIYNSFGYGEDACLNIAQAIELAPKDFALVLKGAEYHNKAARFDDAIKLVDQAEKLSASDEEQESVLNTRIDVLQSSQRLDAIVEAMEKMLEADPASKASDWYRLARYQEAQRRWDDASASIDKAIEKDSQSILALTAAARIAESAGDFGRAADLFRKLTQVDRRSISDHWTSVTRLETQLGRKEQALDAAKQLIVAAPSKTENYEFYAQTCFRLGETEEGMQALRKAIRINPNEPGLMMTLGTALADQMRTDEAIELYWRAYDQSEDITDKSSMVTKLVPLYSQINQFEKLIERLERERQEEESRRSATICIAQAWQTAGDIAEARKELEGLLGDNTKDTNLLNQLAKLCQSDSDMDAAINYQRQLVGIAPGDETEAPLAAMLLTVGEIDEAKGIYAKLIEAEEDPVRQLRSLDSLLNSGNFDTALRVMEPLLDKQRDDWELLYRYGVCWANLKNSSEAKARFDRIVSLSIPHESLGRSAQAKLKQAQEKAKSDNLRGINTAMPVRQSALQMLQQSSVVRNAAGLEQEDYYGNTQSTLWTPPSYGLARMAALGWLIKMEQDASDSQKLAKAPSESSDATPSFTDAIRDKATASGASQRDLLDGLYVCALKNEYDQIFGLSKRMAQSGGMEEKRFFLQSLASRNQSESQRQGYGGEGQPEKTPLNDADLEFMQACFDEVTAKQKDQNLESIYGSNLAYDSDGQAYIRVGAAWQALPGVFRFQNRILEEYRTAGKTDRVNELIQKQIDSAKSAAEWIGLVNVLRQEKRESEIPATIDKWVTAAKQQIAETPVTTNRRQSQQSQVMPLGAATNTLQQWIGQLGGEEENDRIFQLLESILPIAVAEGKHRAKVAAAAKTSPAANSSANQQAANVNIQTYYGQTQNQVRIVFPPVSREVDTAAIMMLRQFYDVLIKNGVGQDMVNRLRRRVESATDDAEYWQWYLASVLWWSDEQDEAMQIVTKIIEQHPNEPRMQFRWASLLESRDEFEEALKIIDQITPRDQSNLIRRETAALRLAERIGDIDRAKQSAERLFGLRLTSDAQMQLLPQLRRLGMDTQADALLARLEKTSARQPGSQVSLMNLYQSQGKTESANQAALAILRRTTSSFAASRNSGTLVNPRYSQNSSSSERSAALAQLASSGALPKMIEALKEKLAKSPDSIYTLEQLIEYSKAANQNEKADEYLAQAIALRPESSILRWNLATNLMAKNKFSDACDQYLILFDAQPSWLAENFYEVSRAFSQAKRKKELIAKCQSIDMKRFRNPWELMNLVNNSINEEPESAELFVPLIERFFESNPSNRSYFVSNLVNQRELVNNERIYALVKRSVLPQSPSIVADGPWIGLDDITGYGQDGQVTLVFTSLLEIVQSNPARSEDLKKAIEEKVQGFPAWRGGQAMLALIDMAGAKQEEGRKQLEAMLADEASWKAIPDETLWFLGQRLSDSDASQDLAFRLLKKAELSSTTNRGDLQYTPVAALARIAKRIPQERAYVKQRIDQRLREQKTQPINYGNPEYEVYQRIRQAISTSGMFASLDYPIDAYLAVKDIQDEPGFEKASRYFGSVEYLTKQLDEKTTSAKNAITDRSLIESLDRVLPEKQGVDLQVRYPSFKGTSKQKIESGLLEILRLTTTTPESKKIITDRIRRLSEQQPNDLSVNLVRALWMMEQDCDGETLAPELVKLLDLAQLEPIAPGRRANNRQRREAKIVSDVWILAREILDGDSLSSSDADDSSSGKEQSIEQPSKTRSFASHAECRRLALQLADVAVEASARQLTVAEQSMSLLELADIQTRQKDWEQAERSWERLLALGTAKPSKSSSEPKAEGQPQPVKPSLEPPLTISQFRIAMRVYTMAVSSGRSNMANKALAMSLRGGMPVPDPELAPKEDPSGGMMVMSMGASSNAPSKDPIEAEVQDLLTKAFTLGGSSSETPAELYDALRLIALPTNRPDQIRLYVNSAAVENGREESLATSLVQSAAKAGKLEELRKEVEARDTKANSLLSKKSLLALIAMASGNIAESQSFLEEIGQLSDKTTSDVALHAAGLAAVRAFSNPELRQAASPIMDRLAKKQLTTTKSRNEDVYSSDPRTRPLASEFVIRWNRHLVSEGKSDEARDNFEMALQMRAKNYEGYGASDYVRVLQRRDLGALAKNALQLGMTDYAAELLGRYADIPDAPQYGSSDSASLPLEFLIRWYRGLSNKDRYQLWHEWTMPNEKRGTLRVVYGTVRSVRIPSVFSQSTERGKRIGDQPLQAGMASNLLELVSAAAQCYELESLKQQVEALDRSLDPARQVLLDLICIHQNNDAELTQCISDRVAQYRELGKTRSENPSDNNYAQIYGRQLENMLIAEACREFGYEREADRLTTLSNSANKPRKPLVGDDSYWLADSMHQLTNRMYSSDDESDHYATSGEGSNAARAMLRFPLAGDFTLSWDCPRGNPTFEFGGVLIQAEHGFVSDSSGMITQIPTVRTLPEACRIEVQVVGDQATFLIGDQAITKEWTWGTSPWLAINTSSTGMQWRNLRIEGNPTIPSEVSLIANDSMDGWSSTFFREEQRKPRLNADRIQMENLSPSRTPPSNQKLEPKAAVWRVDQGQIRGRPVTTSMETLKGSWLVYQRPLASGETFRYEFFSQGDRMVAHPTFGDVAMVLAPGGLQLHYVPINETTRVFYDIDSENLVPVDASVLQVDRLPLKENDWNQVSLTCRENQIDLSLNGTLVYSTPVESDSARQFGFFRYQHQESLIRNAVLTGPWPQRVTEALIADVNAKNLRYRSDVPVDQSFSYSADSLSPWHWQPPAQKGDVDSFRTLLDMVLPSDAKYPRMSFDLRGVVNSGRVVMKMDCVAVELARCAKRNNMSNELLQALDAFQAKNPDAQQALDALRCLIAIESLDEKQARSQMQSVIETMGSDENDLTKSLDQTALFIVAKHTSTVPALQDLALVMTEKLQKIAIEKRDKTRDESLMNLINSLYGDLRFAMVSASFSKDSGASSQWAMISPDLPTSVVLGGYDSQPSTWLTSRGKAVHFGANQRSMLAFQSPLMGDFEIVAERTTWDRQEMEILYAGHSAEPKYDLSGVLVTGADGQTQKGSTLEIPGFRDQGRARFRIAVKDGRVTTFTNDVEIHEQSVSNTVFPWLMLRPAYPEFCGEVEDLRIIGSPTIPDELDLTNPNGYQGWDGGVTQQSIARENDRTYGNWIFGNNGLQASMNSSGFSENYIRYRRPMLEDGIVEYEFQFADSSEIHPAIGSYAFLIRPEGIQIHRVTPLADDVQALLTNNATPCDPPSKPLALRKNEFNKVRLELKGDEVAITINNDPVATVRIEEPATKRHIGLLLLDEKTSVVRNMKYRGQWPKSLPPVTEQYLAKP